MVGLMDRWKKLSGITGPLLQIRNGHIRDIRKYLELIFASPDYGRGTL
jgi:hypothetical protein